MLNRIISGILKMFKSKKSKENCNYAQKCTEFSTHCPKGNFNYGQNVQDLVQIGEI